MSILSARTARRVAAVLAGAALGAGAFAGIASASWVRHDEHRPDAERLLERSTCAGSASAPAGPTATQGVAQVVGVGVRPTALVQLDRSGRVRAAWTNTGCAPRRTDDVYVQRADGTIVPADRSVVHRSWVGDFRDAGVLAPQDDRD